VILLTVYGPDINESFDCLVTNNRTLICLQWMWIKVKDKMRMKMSERDHEMFPYYQTFLPLEFAGTFGKQIIFAVNMDHPVLENAFPLVFDPGHLVIRAEYDISLTRYTFVGFIFLLRGRVIQLTVDSFFIRRGHHFGGDL